MGPHVGDGQVHEGGQAHRAAHEVGEDEEGATVRAGQAISGNAVHDRAHRELAHTEVQVVSEGIALEGLGVAYYIRKFIIYRRNGCIFRELSLSLFIPIFKLVSRFLINLRRCKVNHLLRIYKVTLKARLLNTDISMDLAWEILQNYA